MELKQAIYERRSIRKFKNQQVPKELLETLLEGAVMAPSAVNSQPWYFVAVQSQASMEVLRSMFQDIGEKTRPTLEAAFPGNTEVIEETVSYIKNIGGSPVCLLAFTHKTGGDEVEQMQSVAAAIENFCLLAYEAGLGTCWMTAPRVSDYAERLREAFAPGRGSFVAAIAVGYPDMEPKAPKRKVDRFVIV